MKYAITNAHIINGHRDSNIIDNKIILINDEKIENIVDEDYNIEGYKTIDLQGKYIMPGLINMHVHLPATGKVKKKASDPVKSVKLITSNKLMRSIGIKICTKAAQCELYSGVTTIRTVGGVEEFDTIIRDKINNKSIIGPDIYASNKAISVEGGHMAYSLAYVAKTCEEAISDVSMINNQNVDFIKLMITGGVLDAKVKGEPGVLRMQPEMVKAICDKASEYNLICAAHVESSEGVKVALENGVRSIEHGSYLDDDLIKLFKEKKAFHIATISPALPYAIFDPKKFNISEKDHYNGNVVLNGIIDCAKKCLANDIPVGLGTDTGCPYITHYDMWRELYYFVKYCNVSNNFAIYTATLNNAKLLNIDDEVGSIDRNKIANLIVVDKNPLEDLQALRNVNMVIKRGNIINNPKVKKIKENEIILDKYL